MSTRTLTPAEINAREIRRLRSALRDMERARNLEKSRYESQIRRYESQISSVRRQNDEIRRNAEKKIRNLQSDLRQIEEQSRIRLQRIEREFDQNLRSMEENLMSRIEESEIKIQDWVNEELENQRQEMYRIQEEQQRQIDDLNRQIKEIQNKEANNIQVVKQRFNDVLKLMKNIDEFYPHEKFAPGEMDKLVNEMQMIEKDLESMPQSANSLLHGVFQKLIHLREDVYLKNLKFEREYALLKSFSETIGDQLRQDELPIKIPNKNMTRISFWVPEEYEKLNKRYGELESLLADKKSLSQADLERIEKELITLENDLNNLTEKAMNVAIASRVRAELGKRIAKRLMQKYNNVIVNGYEGEDPRKSYIFSVKKTGMDDATETVVIIHPTLVDDNKIENNILVNTTEYIQTREAGIERTQEVLEGIKDIAEVKSTTCDSMEHDPNLVGEKIIRSVQKGNELPKTKTVEKLKSKKS